MIRAPLALALATAALAVPAAIAAQDPAPRDTIVILPRGGDDAAARTDTLTIGGDEAPALRPSRRGQPFAVRSSGRVAPHAPPRDVVWMHPDSLRRPASGTDSIASDTIAVASADGEADGEILLDTASVEADRPARRRVSTADADAPPSTRRRTTATDGEDAPVSTRRRSAADEEDAPPARRRRNTAADEEAAAEPAPRRTTTRARADSAATRRATAARDRATTATRTTAGGRARTHTVAAGESLFGIARRYGVTTAQLRALNPDVEGERLRVGTELRLPAAARTPAQSGQRATATGERATTPARPATQRGRRTHTVESGETVYGLARRYGVTAAAIREANDLDEDARLRIGQTLVIPRAPQQ